MTHLRCTLGLFAVLAAATSCAKNGGERGSGAVDAPNWRARVVKASAAFPATPLAACTQPATTYLLLSGVSVNSLQGAPPNALPALTFCKRTFGDDDAFFSYRASDKLAWQTKKVESATRIVLFKPTKEVAPKAGGSPGQIGTLTPGVIDGRAVVFSVEGVPECEVPVHAEGPERASSNRSQNIDTVVREDLCRLAGAAVAKALQR